MTIKITLKGEQKTIPELTDEEIELMIESVKNELYRSANDFVLIMTENELIREQYRRKLGIQDRVAEILKATSMSMENK